MTAHRKPRKRKTHCLRGHPRTPENVHPNDACKLCGELANIKRNENRRPLTEEEKITYKQTKYGKMGWTLELMKETSESQNKLCAICKKEKTLVPDHAHTVPPKHRGMLCNNCNAAIGFMYDEPSICEAAAIYLKKWR